MLGGSRSRDFIPRYLVKGNGACLSRSLKTCGESAIAYRLARSIKRFKRLGKALGMVTKQPTGQKIPNSLGLICRGIKKISPLFPSTPAINYALDAPLFFSSFGRLPVRPEDPRATINDFWFYRKLGPWTDFERRCCDKIEAKAIAQSLAPKIKLVQTVAVLNVTKATTADELSSFLEPYRGADYVAKPAHSSGGIMFTKAYASSDVAALLATSQRDYVWWSREAQYAGLPRRILIEPALSKDTVSVPPDYKFFCSKGRVLFCQVDVDRFTNHKRALVDQGFELLGVEFRYPKPEKISRPTRWVEMLARASELSSPFDFVRVDLYDLPAGICFGEFTFTPEAGHAAFSDPQFASKLLTLIGAAWRI